MSKNWLNHSEKNRRLIIYQKDFGYSISMKSTKLPQFHFSLVSWFLGLILTFSDVWNSLRACTYNSASTLRKGRKIELPFNFIFWASQLEIYRMGSEWLTKIGWSKWFKRKVQNISRAEQLEKFLLKSWSNKSSLLRGYYDFRSKTWKPTEQAVEKSSQTSMNISVNRLSDFLIPGAKMPLTILFHNNCPRQCNTETKLFLHTFPTKMRDAFSYFHVWTS